MMNIDLFKGLNRLGNILKIVAEWEYVACLGTMGQLILARQSRPFGEKQQRFHL